MVPKPHLQDLGPYDLIWGQVGILLKLTRGF